VHISRAFDQSEFRAYPERDLLERPEPVGEFSPVGQRTPAADNRLAASSRSEIHQH
jgi:hypothetical protein